MLVVAVRFIFAVVFFSVVQTDLYVAIFTIKLNMRFRLRQNVENKIRFVWAVIMFSSGLVYRWN